MPQHLAKAVGLAVPDEPSINRFARRRRNRLTTGELSTRDTQRCRHPQQRDSVAPLERVPFERAGQHVQRRR
jgi:hypothetical protein